MFHRQPVFRKWVPGWLVKVALFSMLLPSIVVFFLPMSNINAAAGYYGGEPLDIYFAVALFYAGYVGFYALERRFFMFFATKEYFIISIGLNILMTLICYLTNELVLFFPIRFIQGVLFASNVSISLTVMFTRLKSERAREISFSVFFGLILCAIPFNNFVTADLIDSYNFNYVYKVALFSYIPGLIMILFAMNNVHLHSGFPLKKVDWQSFVLYSSILIILAYILIFGQEYYWLTDFRIRINFIFFLILLFIYLYRQRSMKHPYIDLSIFNYKNFIVGILVLFVMYISRFAYNITNSYFTEVLKLDPIHLSYINIFNLAGIVIGVVLSCLMILEKKRIRFIWLLGFLSLFIYFFQMIFILMPEANESNFYLPNFIQGFGIGMIMVPSIVFSISSVPVMMSVSASAICLLIRYLGFCFSITLLNYFSLYEKGRHYNAFQDKLTSNNSNAIEFLNEQTKLLYSKGLDSHTAEKAANKLLVERINQQSTIRYAIDYFELIGFIIFLTILFIVIYPSLNKTAISLKSKVLPPA